MIEKEREREREITTYRERNPRERTIKSTRESPLERTRGENDYVRA